MEYTPDQLAAALALAKLREPLTRSLAVLNLHARKLLAGRGPEQCVRERDCLRDGEIAKWTGIEWRLAPRITRREANAAGAERAAKESPWLFATGVVEFTEAITPGPATLAPPHVIDMKPRPIEVTARAAAETDEAALARATATVRKAHPELTGSALAARSYEQFKADRHATRSAAERAHAVSRAAGLTPAGSRK